MHDEGIRAFRRTFLREAVWGSVLLKCACKLRLCKYRRCICIIYIINSRFNGSGPGLLSIGPRQQEEMSPTNRYFLFNKYEIVGYFCIPERNSQGNVLFKALQPFAAPWALAFQFAHLLVEHNLTFSFSAFLKKPVPAL